ncbi:MAG TPA: phosphatase PAP2 family protein [Acidobacteriaceae bacterium]
MKNARPISMICTNIYVSIAFVLAVSFVAAPTLPANAQSVTDMAILKGLSPVTVLSSTSEGRAALGANYAVTGGIQTGVIRQPILLSFAEQQQQSLRDAFITNGNVAELADGLGTTLGDAYVARAHYIDRDHFTSVSQTIAELIAYASSTSAAHSRAGKYFFANATTDGKNPVSAVARAIVPTSGSEDAFGRAYNLPAGSAKGNPYGNPRPFQTEPSVTRIVGRDYFGTPTDNAVYNRGPMMNLTNSPSFPSGHTVYGYTGSVLLAVLVPERYQQMVARGAEYGNDRILMGAHYAMDVMGGRTLALYDMAHLLANDPAYVGQPLKDAPAIGDFQAAVKAARVAISAALQEACGNTVEVCAEEDTGRFSDPAADEAFYADTQTYGLPVTYPENASGLEDVHNLAPEAGYLLTIAYPSLTLRQADDILTETEGPGGGFLDDGSSFGVYSRFNLYAAAGRAAQLNDSLRNRRR